MFLFYKSFVLVPVALWAKRQHIVPNPHILTLYFLSTYCPNKGTNGKNKSLINKLKIFPYSIFYLSVKQVCL